jgi:hypothetical protein
VFTVPAPLKRNEGQRWWQANADIVRWVMNIASERHIELEAAMMARRKELAARQF